MMARTVGIFRGVEANMDDAAGEPELPPVMIKNEPLDDDWNADASMFDVSGVLEPLPELPPVMKVEPEDDYLNGTAVASMDDPPGAIEPRSELRPVMRRVEPRYIAFLATGTRMSDPPGLVLPPVMTKTEPLEDYWNMMDGSFEERRGSIGIDHEENGDLLHDAAVYVKAEMPEEQPDPLANVDRIVQEGKRAFEEIVRNRMPFKGTQFYEDDEIAYFMECAKGTARNAVNTKAFLMTTEDKELINDALIKWWNGEIVKFRKKNSRQEPRARKEMAKLINFMNNKYEEEMIEFMYTNYNEGYDAVDEYDEIFSEEIFQEFQKMEKPASLNLKFQVESNDAMRIRLDETRGRVTTGILVRLKDKYRKEAKEIRKKIAAQHAYMPKPSPATLSLTYECIIEEELAIANPFHNGGQSWKYFNALLSQELDDWKNESITKNHELVFNYFNL